MTAAPWTKADLRQRAAKGDSDAATMLMLWERQERVVPASRWPSVMEKEPVKRPTWYDIPVVSERELRDL